MATRKINRKSNKSNKIFRKTRSKNSRGYLGGKRKTLKKRKSNKSYKRFRKTRSKKQKGGDETQEEKDKKLLQGAQRNKLDEVREALEMGANVNAVVYGSTALRMASDYGYTEIVRLLIENGDLDVNATDYDDDGRTALHLASIKGHTEIVKMLLEKGADVNAKDTLDRTALQYASQNGHAEIVKLLEEAIANNTENNSSDESQEEKDKKLLQGAQRNKLDEVREALEMGANVNVKNDDGWTAIAIASQQGSIELVEMLLEKRANVNVMNNNGNTALISASYKGYKEIVTMLLEAGAEVNAKNNDGYTALMKASLMGHPETVAILEEAIANNTENNSSEESQEETQEEKDTKLINAARDNELDNVRAALAEGANVNAKGEVTGYTALIWASEKGHEDIVKKLLAAGADVNAKGSRLDYTPLMRASLMGHKDIVAILLDKGADVNAKDTLDRTALSEAIRKNEEASRTNNNNSYKDIIAMLENAIANNTENNSSEETQEEKDTKLLNAANNNKLDKVKEALDKGANVNAKTFDDWTALQLVSWNGHAEIVFELLEKGADVNMNDNEDGSTALQLASRYGHTEIVSMLLNYGAIVNEVDNDGYTALQYASNEGHTNIVAMLLEKGADVNANNEYDGNTALHMASMNDEKENTDIVRMLLEKGADVNATNKDGSTALSRASRNGHTEIMKLLKKAMGIKEENFIVDKFCKCKAVTYFDVIDGEITRDIQEYLQEDKDNIMLIYKSNKADTDLEYFGTTRPIITQQYNDEHNLFYGCNKVIIPPPFVPRKEDYNKNDVYFKLSKIGLVGTSSEYCDVNTLLKNKEHQLFAIKNLDKKYPSFVAKHVLGNNPNVISGSHCQGGDAASVSTLIKAYPKNEEFPEISNSNMLQETPPTEPLPPPPFTTDDSGPLTMDDLRGGKRKTKRSKKKSNKRVRKTRSKKYFSKKYRKKGFIKTRSKRHRHRGGGGQFSKQNPPTKSKMEPETSKFIPKKVTFPEPDEIKKEYSDDPRFSDEFYNTKWFSKKEAEDEVIKEQKKEDKKLCKEQGWVEKKDILMCMNRERIKRENEKKENNKTKKENKKKATINYYNRQEKIEKQQMLDDFTKQYNENKK